jgi:hypothetical protein
MRYTFTYDGHNNHRKSKSTKYVEKFANTYEEMLSARDEMIRTRATIHFYIDVKYVTL